MGLGPSFLAFPPCAARTPAGPNAMNIETSVSLAINRFMAVS